MTIEERSEIIRVLENSREEVNAAVRGLQEALASAKPDPARWSVLECLEHIATVEERFLGRLENAQLQDEARVDRAREADLAARVTNRSVRAQAPEPAVPKGRFASVEQALEHFNAARARTLQFVHDRGADLYRLAAEHPRFGSVNGKEVLLIIAGHAQRHAEQIREITAAAA